MSQQEKVKSENSDTGSSSPYTAGPNNISGRGNPDSPVTPDAAGKTIGADSVKDDDANRE